jgi:hypothetical protein
VTVPSFSYQVRKYLNWIELNWEIKSENTKFFRYILFQLPWIYFELNMKLICRSTITYIVIIIYCCIRKN